MKPVRVYGYNDNEASRIAFKHGCSPKMSHLGKYAEVHFRFVQGSGLIPTHVDGLHNVADIFTKVLPAKRLRWLLRKVFGLENPMEDRALLAMVNKHQISARACVGKIFTHLSGCEHEKYRDFGRLMMATCFCRMQEANIELEGTPRAVPKSHFLE